MYSAIRNLPHIRIRAGLRCMPHLLHLARVFVLLLKRSISYSLIILRMRSNVNTRFLKYKSGWLTDKFSLQIHRKYGRIQSL